MQAGWVGFPFSVSPSSRGLLSDEQLCQSYHQRYFFPGDDEMVASFFFFSSHQKTMSFFSHVFFFVLLLGFCLISSIICYWLPTSGTGLCFSFHGCSCPASGRCLIFNCSFCIVFFFFHSGRSPTSCKQRLAWGLVWPPPEGTANRLPLSPTRQSRC